MFSQVTNFPALMHCPYHYFILCLCNTQLQYSYKKHDLKSWSEISYAYIQKQNDLGCKDCLYVFRQSLYKSRYNLNMPFRIFTWVEYSVGSAARYVIVLGVCKMPKFRHRTSILKKSFKWKWGIFFLS